ncbi:DUF1330 domain-containing protein [Sphingobium scionense]|jgi:uncharacterized protein (DUF1330 family)|uniref:DUF1330 domain-containing protein n=4 Tax=Sphingomonadaceae TaxID=41297 RepID=A0A4Q4IPX3_SPHSA|nr:MULTISPECIES: DUF1330 domain-containing protein [Sphingomonadaceae]KFD28039.1 hypothetical protein IH86_11470 [Sphingobium yanoikuyae]MAX16165.1 DUF1330 domain-containing protein [Sphingobium sp.]MBB4149541.1 uncharacterized protein (DUF1330 family) [Sphingobium scionense]MDV3480930.1 DUF1330 domain-containing protein [Sphingobium yanoikuyae]QOT74319.1 DUF1330 domain-containing protein [Sphingobium fuliginis]|tara:strand:+ start:76 stop:363 length:288 start_codon:yes stop_codon:yes gene_type:complete
MAAYFIASVTSHDDGWVADYQANVPPMVARFGGELICRSNQFERFEGEGAAPHYTVIIRFPAMADVQAFMACPDYAPFKVARIAGATSDIFAVAD